MWNQSQWEGNEYTITVVIKSRQRKEVVDINMMMMNNNNVKYVVF